jgi:hypothetical protein
VVRCSLNGKKKEEPGIGIMDLPMDAIYLLPEALKVLFLLHC